MSEESAIPQCEAVEAAAKQAKAESVAVIAVDESPLAQQGFQWATQTLDVDLYIVLHIQHSEQLDPLVLHNEQDLAAQAPDHTSIQLRKKYLQIAKDTNVPRCEFWVKVSADEFGAAIVTTIEGLQQKFGSVTLVVGDRQENILKKTFFGSVSDYVLKKCPCPVVVLKGAIRE